MIDSIKLHIKKMAIKKVDEKLMLNKITKEELSKEDYETLVEEAIKEVKEDYATKIAGIAVSALGLDLFFSF